MIHTKKTSTTTTGGHKMSEAATRKTLINSMTNWQRNQAGRKCKGRFKDLTLTQLHEFAAMTRSG